MSAKNYLEAFNNCIYSTSSLIYIPIANDILTTFKLQPYET